MAIIDLIKKKNPDPQKKEKASVAKKDTSSEKSKEGELANNKESRLAFEVIKHPHITEKATDLMKQNQYVFKVYPDANKIEVKRAIEEIYKVKVESVRIINIPPKKRRLGRFEGYKSGYKKAIVRLKPGQKIEVISH